MALPRWCFFTHAAQVIGSRHEAFAAFVETPFYVVAAAFVIFIAVFWFALNHDKTLLLAFVASAVFVVVLSAMFGIFGIF